MEGVVGTGRLWVEEVVGVEVVDGPERCRGRVALQRMRPLLNTRKCSSSGDRR